MSNAILVLKRSNIILQIAFLGLIMSFIGLQIARSASAESGLTVEVTRNGNMLIATAMTVKGSNIVEESWRSMKSDECNLGLFAVMSGADKMMNDGWSLVLTSDDAGANYCFYVEDSQGRQAVEGFEIVRPIVRITQSNDQLRASVINEQSENLQINEDSWRWFRYNHVDGSGFGCQSQHLGLDDEGLRQAADAAEEKQQAGQTSDVYNAQKGVYRTGEGSSVNLTEADTGLTYCFSVSDVAGIGNSYHTTINKVTPSADTGKKDAGDDPVLENSDPGQIGANPADPNSSDPSSNNNNNNSIANSGDDESENNLLRHIGLGLLGIALIIGAVMLIKGSQVKDDKGLDGDASPVKVKKPKTKA